MTTAIEKKNLINAEFFPNGEFTLHLSNNEFSFDFEYAPIDDNNGNIFFDILINPNSKTDYKHFEADFNNSVISNKAIRTRTGTFSNLKHIIAALGLNDNKIPSTKLEAFSILINAVKTMKSSLYSNTHFLDLNNRMMLASESGNNKRVNYLFDQVQPLLIKAILKLNIPIFTKIAS